MINQIAFFIQNTYGPILCVIIVLSFLLVSRKSSNRIVSLFVFLCFLTALEVICGCVERYLGTLDVYYPARRFFAWGCYISVPFILLTICQIQFRHAKKNYKIALTMPSNLNILVVSTTFFADWCFGYDTANNTPLYGPLIHVPLFVPLLYSLIIVGGAIYTLKKNKWESIILIVSVGLLLLDYVNEIGSFININLREITLGIITLTYFMYFASKSHLDEVEAINMAYTEGEEKYTREMVDQCIETLAYTIDAKDKYTKGHSSRVAKYSRMMAQIIGKSELECRNIYLAGLLHDIGKISISDAIINKIGKLSESEMEQIRNHPENGAKILEKMKSLPFLQNGAKYHHERYDGKGYPMGLKGEAIPEIARIIAVADAYDAMTSKRSYRAAMDQITVKQEIWKGMGTQFDPLYAKVMISIIDSDYNFEMRENHGKKDDISFDEEGAEITWGYAPVIDKKEEVTETSTQHSYFAELIYSLPNWSNPSSETPVDNGYLKVKFKGTLNSKDNYLWCAPTILLYSSEDGKILGPGYDELGVILSSGYSWKSGSTVHDNSDIKFHDGFESWDDWHARNVDGMDYTLTVKVEKGTYYINVSNEFFTVNSLFRFPRNWTKKVYLAFTGDCCKIEDVRVIQ